MLLPVQNPSGRSTNPNSCEDHTINSSLSRDKCIIVIDNVVREGAVADGGSRDPSVIAMRRVLQAIAAEPRVAGTVLQTVGAKGYDGLAVLLVTS